MRHKRLKHRFVQHIPRPLEPGVLYVSIDYATAVHSCCCGCGEEVVTPLTPTDWRMTFDGETISLWPSIGNWNFACRSHYFIERGQIIEALPWEQDQIDFGRRNDKSAKTKHYELGKPAGENHSPRSSSPIDEQRTGPAARVRRKSRY
jgi:hypothetical protein